jgi:hypothetical protein
MVIQLLKYDTDLGAWLRIFQIGQLTDFKSLGVGAENKVVTAWTEAYRTNRLYIPEHCQLSHVLNGGVIGYLGVIELRLLVIKLIKVLEGHYVRGCLPLVVILGISLLELLLSVLLLLLL